MTGSLLEILKFGVGVILGREIDQLLDTKQQKRDFKKALTQALDDLKDSGYDTKGKGKIDRSMLISTETPKALFRALLDPAADGKIDIDNIAGDLEEIYPGYSATPADKETIKTFVESVHTHIQSYPSLQPLLNTKILQRIDPSLMPGKEDNLIQSYLDKKISEITEEMQELLGEGVTYIDPLIEKEIKKEKFGRRFDHPPSLDRPGAEKQEEERFEQIDIGDYFLHHHHNNAAIIADSGYGKTTLLQQIFLRTANAYNLHSRIPVLWPHGRGQTCTEDNIRDRLRQFFMMTSYTREQVERFVDEQFDAGNFVFLIDALDQMTPGNRSRLVGCLGNNGFAPNRVVVSVRPNVWDGVQGHMRKYDRLEIRQFDQGRWERYLGEDNLRQIKNIIDDDFLAVPILLKLVTEHWLPAESRTPPKNRADLYNRMFTNLLKRQEDKDASGETDTWHVHKDLKLLAYRTMADPDTAPGQFPRTLAIGILGEDKIKRLEKRRGLVTILEPGNVMAFRHRSFQEFLAAQYLHEFLKRHDYNFDLIDSYLYHPDWEESLRFLAGILPDDKAEILVKKLIETPKRKSLTLYRDHLRLAALCLREIDESSQNLGNDILRQCHEDLKKPYILDYAISIMTALRATDSLVGLLNKSNDLKIRRLAAQALGFIKDDRAYLPLISFFLEREIDPSVRGIAAESLALLNRNDVVPILIEGINDGDIDIRMYSARALIRMNESIVNAHLLKAVADKDRELRARAEYVLESLTSKHTLNILVDYLSKGDSDLRSRAARILGAIRSPLAVPALINALNDVDLDVVRNTINALKKIEDNRAVLPLISILKVATDVEIQLSVVPALGKLNDERAVEPLIDLLKRTTNDYVKESIGEALGTIQSSKAVAPLINVMQKITADDSVRYQAAYALGKIKDKRAVKPLMALLRPATTDYVLGAVAYSLGAIKNERAVKPLIKLLKFPTNDHVKITAVSALGEIRDGQAIEPIIDFIKETTDGISHAFAISALAKIDINQATKIFIDWLKTSYTNENFFSGLCYATHFLKPYLTTEPLIELFRCTTIDKIREYVAFALMFLRSDQAVEPLINIVNTSTDRSVRGAAAMALVGLQSSRASSLYIKMLKSTTSELLQEQLACVFLFVKDHNAIEPLIDIMKSTNSESLYTYAAQPLDMMDSYEALVKMVAEYKKSRSSRIRKSLLPAIASCDRAVRRKEKAVLLED